LPVTTRFPLVLALVAAPQAMRKAATRKTARFMAGSTTMVTRARLQRRVSLEHHEEAGKVGKASRRLSAGTIRRYRAESEAAIREKYSAIAPALDERARRLWAAAESRAIGYGGDALVSAATGLAPRLVAALERLVDPLTRGDPMSPLRWTCKSRAKLASALSKDGWKVSRRSRCGQVLA
jgi:DDE family transposase